MLFTVSTVKDTLPNLERFVARNLASGVDHQFVFVDNFDASITAALNENPHVTAISTGPGWWHGKRPRQLNVRQRINANVAKVVLRALDGPEWLFHIDADEVLLADRAELAAVPERVTNVRALPFEAVSRPNWPGGKVTHFKRMLDQDQLELLRVVGLIPEAHNGAYFHGHCDGKSGVRPAMNRWLTLHSVHAANQKKVLAPRLSSSRLLHYESWSGEEFVRKWSNLLGPNTQIKFRPRREPVAAALRALAAADLDERTRRRYLEQLYDRTTRDDFEQLLELGLLEEIDPLAGGHRPARLDPARQRELDLLVAAIRPVNTWPFNTGRTEDAMHRVLAEVADNLAIEDPALADRARERWARVEGVDDAEYEAVGQDEDPAEDDEPAPA